MAQFAPVCPIQILEAMKVKGVLGKYHLLLAHHVLEFPERFATLFADLKGCTIIMDNSLVELGSSQNEALVLEACQAIQKQSGTPNWIFPVLSDVMGDGKATREASLASIRWWNEHMPANIHPYKFMAVAQGTDWADYTASVDYFCLSGLFPSVEYIGVPRVLTKNIGSRQLALQYLDAVAPEKSVHLLGFSDDVTDDVICANMPMVEGIDSAVPIRFSYSQDDPDDSLYTPTREIPKRPEDWFEKGVLDDATITNLVNVRKWCA